MSVGKNLLALTAMIYLSSANILNVKNKNTLPEVKYFSKNITFGAATAAYQVEGAWADDGKGLSVWDYLVRSDPDHIKDRSSGDVACNSYYNYKRDIEMLQQLGAKAYRFSISWPRILPAGRPSYINERGVDYYNRLIDGLLAAGIEPFVTMFHWDMPHVFGEAGGWMNDDMVDIFADYARVLFQRFGDRVKNWMTINEPQIHCSLAYSIAEHAPRISSPGQGFYDCGRNVLLAHAKAYRLYQEEFKASQNGQIGLVISMDWALAESNSTENQQVFEDYMAFEYGQYMDPIYSAQGNYPQRMIDRVAEMSRSQGLEASRLRPFTQEQVDMMRGSADFLALNHYSSNVIYRNASLAFDSPSEGEDMNIGTYKDPSWPTSETDWMMEYAPGFYALLMYTKDTYNNVPVYVTENGFSSTTGLNDDARTRYYRHYLSALADALADGADVRGYFAWSLMDNFEWASGYVPRMGLFEVDMDDPERPRTPRKSAHVYKEIIRSNSIDFSYEVDPYSSTFGNSATSADLLFSSLLLGVALHLFIGH